MKYLILGASSYIGGYIYDRMRENGIDVIGTHCHTVPDKGALYFDILQDDMDQFLGDLESVPDIAIICIAQTNFDRCADDYEKAYAVNVDRMKELICRLHIWKIKIIYLSSDNVFDGEKGNYIEQDRTHAIGKYGMMKEEMEHYILENFPSICILRIAKPISSRRAKRNLLTEWEHKTNNQETILCIKDNYMSFVAIEDLYRICVMAGSQTMQGVYHIAGDRFYSRKELAVKFLEYLGVDRPSVEERELQEFGFKDIRPLNTSMCNQKFKKETGYQFIPVEEVLKAYVEGMRKNG